MSLFSPEEEEREHAHLAIWAPAGRLQPLLDEEEAAGNMARGELLAGRQHDGDCHRHVCRHDHSSEPARVELKDCAGTPSQQRAASIGVLGDEA